MKHRRVRLKHQWQRPVLSDTLPFEVPILFSNRHFYDFIVTNDVSVRSGKLTWNSDSAQLDRLMYLLSGVSTAVTVESETYYTSGKEKHRRLLSLTNHNLAKIPFQFDICHKKTDARTLSVPHPLSQLAVAGFYNSYADAIRYYACRGKFSIRAPKSIARYSNFLDKTHTSLLTKEQGGVEEVGKEYDQIGSFFVYRSVNNVFKFFESYRYHRAEKRFDAMAQIDISKCFDSIYTHSLPWAVAGKRAIKDDLIYSVSTFGGHFDRLMQGTNQNETNGIIIGPEFSRVFAEIILQSVDVRTEKTLRQEHKLVHRRDYEIFRYVDDYFVFYNKVESLPIISETLRHHLNAVKLHINPDKTKVYEKPVITEITIAKTELARLIDDVVIAKAVEADSDKVEPALNQQPVDLQFSVNSRNLIIRYKSVLKTSDVTYIEVGNFTFALVERGIDRIISLYEKCVKSEKTDRKLVIGLTGVMEFCFFVYAASPRVNLSIRLARIIVTITKALRDSRVDNDLRHHFFKYVNDNLTHQLRKNQSLEYKEVETLYLLTALGEIGKEYWLEEDVLRYHLRIGLDSAGKLYRKERLNYFSIVVSLSYMRTKKRYNDLRAFVIKDACLKIEEMKEYKHNDAEALMLFLDCMACPYIPDADKDLMASHFNYTLADAKGLASHSKNWFITWDNFNVAKELDAKRSREVY